MKPLSVSDSESQYCEAPVLTPPSEAQGSTNNSISPNIVVINGDSRHMRIHRPYFVIFISSLIWSFYLFGLIIHSHLKATETSPTQASMLWFYTVSGFPYCIDMRRQGWRVMTNQFCHKGLQHIGFNSLLLVPFGVICEAINGAVFSAIVFESGVLFGTLGYSRFTPYRGLVGCSHGVCGILGGSFATLIYNYRSFPKIEQVFSMLFLYAITILMMLVDYYTNKEPNVAHLAHLFGGIGGFLVGLTIIPIHCQVLWKSILKCCGVTAFFVLLCYLLFQYSLIWPPIAQKNYCCYQVIYSKMYPSLALDPYGGLASCQI
jgi:membrane associated rhomboid family serine protease